METPDPLPPEARWRPLLAWIRPHRGAFAAAVVLGGLASVLEVASIGLVVPLLQVTDAGIGGGGLGVFSRVLPLLRGLSPNGQRALLISLMMAAVALRGVCWWASAALRERLGASIHAEGRLRVFRRLARAPLAWLEKRPVGEQDALLLHETDRLAMAATGFVQLTVMSAMAFCYALLLFYMAPALTGAALVFLALVAGAVRLLRRPIEAHAQRMRLEARAVAGSLRETLSALHLLKQVGRADDAVERFDAASRLYLESQRRQRRALDAIPPVAELSGTLVVLAIFWIGSTLLPIRGHAEPVLLLPYVFIFYRLLPRFLAIPTARAQLAANLSSVPALDRFLSDAGADPLPDGGKDLGPGPHRVAFEGVRFRYAEGGPWVLDGFDLALEPGTTTALVGRSGAGKSTVVDLLLGLRRPTSGRVVVGGRDLADLDGDRWRRAVGVVPQDPRLFDGSVADNLRLVAPGAAPERVAACLETAQAGFVARLPQGTDTPLGDRGARLSGGERQRVCVARALMQDPLVLVFDEPTAHLDADAERAVTAALARASRGRTVLLVAHRLSTVKGAGTIALLEGGRVVESGSHESLMARGGEYARLVRLGLDDLTESDTLLPSS